MRKVNLKRTATALACLGLVCGLLPVFGQSKPQRQVASSIEPKAVLGVTAPKTPNVEIISARDARFAQSRARDATGDTYDAAGLIQDANSAYWLDGLPDNHTFGTGVDESAGAHEISGVDVRIVGTDFGPGVPDTNFLQVNYFTVDSSDLVPAGSISPDQLPFTAWRFDVGTTAAGTDKIEWIPNPGFTVVDSGFCLLEDLELLGCFPLVVHDSDANGVSGVGVVGLDPPADIAGYGVDEMVMYWEIQLEPSCGDGHIDPGEECDDGNTVSGDGCSATCQNELAGDLDDDGDVDLRDFYEFMQAFQGPVGS